MKFARTFSIQPNFPSASIIEIETDIQPGIFFFTLIGLADTSIRESRSRILSAIKNSGLQSPKSRLQKITALLRPAGVKKYGSIHDLAIAVSYLLTQQKQAATEQSLLGKKVCFLGELTLEGKIVSCFGIEQAIATGIKEGFDAIFYPSGTKLSFVRGTLRQKSKLIPIKSLSECLQIMNQQIPTATPDWGSLASEKNPPEIFLPKKIADGLILALGGGHHIIFFGEPGTGKTFCTNQIEHVLPPLTTEETFERSLLGLSPDTSRPIRRPHTSSSFASILGNTSTPGEILKSHKGILIMNEFTEFDRRTIETLREPLEERVVSLSRSQGNTEIPCDFTLIATTNMCRCGYYRSQNKKCTCSQADLRKSQEKISGPILDRFEIRINTNIKSTTEDKTLVGLREIREKISRITNAQLIQTETLIGRGDYYKNLPENLFWQNLSVSAEAKAILDRALSEKNTNQRVRKHLWSLAKSYSDMRGSKNIEEIDILNALEYRLEDPKNPL